MKFRANHFRIGPLRINLSTHQARKTGNPLSSVSLDLGAPVVRLWSRDGTRGLTSIDTPGQGSLHFQPKTRQQRAQAEETRTNANTYPPLSFDPRA